MTTPYRFNFLKAHRLISQNLAPNPLAFSEKLSELSGYTVYLKWESRHFTGSFKERGVINFLSNLQKEQKEKDTQRNKRSKQKLEVCAASAGNHALALSYYSNKFSIPCQIVMPRNAPLTKIRQTEKYKAKVILEGDSFNEAYNFGTNYSKENDLIFVSPYDHNWIVEGQGTCGREIIKELPDCSAVIVPFGGGGLLGGSAMAVKEINPKVFFLGVRSKVITNPPHNLPANHPLQPTSIADGISPKGPGVITTPIVENYVDAVCTVEEEEIAHSVIKLLEFEKSMVEGAGAVGVAALLKGSLPKKYKKVAIVISGSNIDLNLMSRLIEKDMAYRGRILKLTLALPDRPGAINTISGILKAQSANLLEIYHDRWFSPTPNNVNITFVMETKDFSHQELIIEAMKKSGIPPL